MEFDKRSLLTRHSGGLTISLDDDVVPAPGWGEPVWSPWGPGHMGTTPGSHRDDTRGNTVAEAEIRRREGWGARPGGAFLAGHDVFSAVSCRDAR